MTDELEDVRRCWHCYADIVPDHTVAGRWIAVTAGNKAKSPSCMYPAALFHIPLPLIEISQ
jgi:hypothetical protein